MSIEKNKKHFWKIDIEIPKLIISLKKLGISQDEINYFLDNKNLHPPFYDKKSILLAPYDSDMLGSQHIRCNWNYCNATGWYDFISDGYIYKGKIKVLNEEIITYKYNL